MAARVRSRLRVTVVTAASDTQTARTTQVVATRKQAEPLAREVAATIGGAAVRIAPAGLPQGPRRTRRDRLPGNRPYAITYICMPPREWDASSYDRVSDPQLAMARDVIDRLDLRGDERVLDAGCGTGRVTALARPRPRRRRDRRRRQRGDGRRDPQALRRRVTAFTSDLVELELDEPVDAILSTATFHWIDDHDRLFARLHAALKPGGRFAAQCGGAGNIVNVQAAIDAVDHPALRGWAGPWNYATPEATPTRACTPRASTTSGRGCSPGRSSPRTRTSTSRP